MHEVCRAIMLACEWMSQVRLTCLTVMLPMIDRGCQQFGIGLHASACCCVVHGCDGMGGSNIVQHQPEPQSVQL